MADWETRRLGDAAQLKMGQSPPGPRVTDLDRGLPFLQGNAEFGSVCPTATLQCDEAPRRSAPGDSLISVRAPVGAINRADRGYGIGRGLAAVTFDMVDPDFGHHALVEWSRDLQRVSQGTTFSAIGRIELAALQFPVPPLEEQRRIAEILDTIDETIQATERVIAKLTVARVGLLHEQLAPGMSTSPPREWEVFRVEELLGHRDPSMRSGPFGSTLLASELVDEGVPLLGIDNAHRERFVADYHRFVGPAKAHELRRYRVFPRDLMITIMGTVGRCCVVPDSVAEALSSKHVWTLTLDSERYLPELACLQVNYSSWALAHFGRDEQGGIMSAIRSETLRSLRLPTPPMAEQRRIWAVLHTAAGRIEAQAAALSKLRELRSGLAADLLSGQVRTVAA